jgi:Dodecin
MSVARVTEIISSSKNNFEDAVEKGINRAVKTLKNVEGRVGQEPEGRTLSSSSGHSMSSRRQTGNEPAARKPMRRLEIKYAVSYGHWLLRFLFSDAAVTDCLMWPISTRVNKPENDDPAIMQPVELATDAA